MKKTLTLSLALALGITPLSASQKRPEGTEVIVVADASPAPNENPRPSPDNPIFYLLTTTHRTLGHIVAGVKLPKAAEIESAVEAGLARQGYVRSRVGGPIPSILIVAAWGDANFKQLPVITISESMDDISPIMSGSMVDNGPSRGMVERVPLGGDMLFPFQDRLLIERFVGTSRAESMKPWETTRIYAASNEDRYYLSLTALDFAGLRETPKRHRLIWRTSMTIDYRENFNRALPVMLASAGPYFGRSAELPVLIDERDRRESQVDIGDLRVMPERAAPPAPLRKR